MAFKDLEEFAEPWLDLPIKGITYRIPSVDAKTGIYCQRIVEVTLSVQAGADVSDADVAGLQLDDDAERDFNKRLLGGVDDEGNTLPGSAYEQMIANDVPWEFIKIAARTVFTWTVRDRGAAEEFWARGGRPEASRPATQDRRRPAKKTAKKTKKSARQGSPATSTTT